jgi:uncharacterized Fe-S cluster protein YjdI
MPVTTHTYTKEGLTVVWKPDLCIHSGICAKGLQDVFNPRRRPWIDLTKAEKEQIKEQIKKCPSEALSFLDGGEE